jgi:hypothetical protein
MTNMSLTALSTRHVHVLLTGISQEESVPLQDSLPRCRIASPKLLSGSRWNGRWIQASPYEEDSNLTDLEPLDLQSQLFALALMSMRNTDEHYRDSSYEEALNWTEVKAKLQELAKDVGIEWKAQTFYVVEFRSTLKDNIDVPLLYRLDKESHREASESGGLLKYWYGTPDSKRRNLATCKCVPTKSRNLLTLMKACGETSQMPSTAPRAHNTSRQWPSYHQCTRTLM